MSGREDREIVRFGEELARVAPLRAPDSLRAQLRASLLAAPVVLPRRAPAGFRIAWLRPALAALVILAIVGGGGGYAAAASLPGDPAFTLKRAAEETQVALTIDDATRLDERVTQSDRRIADLQTVAAQRPTALTVATDEYLAAVARVDEALRVVLGQARSEARDSAAARAGAASTEHIALLRSLAARLPAEAQQGIQRAIDAQQTVHGRSGDPPGRPSAPGASGGPSGTPGSAPSRAPVPSGRPSEAPASPGRGGPPTGVPGRP